VQAAIPTPTPLPASPLIGDPGPVLLRLASLNGNFPHSQSIFWIHLPLLGEPIQQEAPSRPALLKRIAAHFLRRQPP